MDNQRYYDTNMRDMSRDLIRSFLKFYFEYSFQAGSDDDYPIEIVAGANEILMNIEDDDISDQELVAIYIMAMDRLAETGAHKEFTKFPVLFMKDDMGIPYGDQLFGSE